MRSAVTRIQDFELVRKERVIERKGYKIMHNDPLFIGIFFDPLPMWSDDPDSVNISASVAINFDTFPEANETWQRVLAARNPLAYSIGIHRRQYPDCEHCQELAKAKWPFASYFQ